MSTPPGWYPDQENPALRRWWDGNTWTQHTQPNGPRQAPPPAAAPQPPSGTATGSPLYTEPSLKIAQRAQFMKIRGVSYTVSDRDDNHLGTLKQTDKTGALEMLTEKAKWLTERYEVRDGQGNALLQISKPKTLVMSDFKPTFLITRADRTPLGEIRTEGVIANRKLGFYATGTPVGQLSQARGTHYAITDEAGAQVAEIHRQLDHRSSLKETFTTDDIYFLERPRPVPEPLGSFVLAAVLAFDVAFRQHE